jgi:hypothetical protein
MIELFEAGAFANVKSLIVVRILIAKWGFLEC